MLEALNSDWAVPVVYNFKSPGYGLGVTNVYGRLLAYLSIHQASSSSVQTSQRGRFSTRLC